MQTLREAAQAVLDRAEYDFDPAEGVVVPASVISDLSEAINLAKLADLIAASPVWDSAANGDSEYEATHLLHNENGTYYISNPRVEGDDERLWIVAPYRTLDSSWICCGSFKVNAHLSVVALNG